MSHKTGKRVLTASTSLALAVVGLAASPLAAHAAAGDITFTNNCGPNDTAKIKIGSGTYSFQDAQGNTLQSINSATGALTAGSISQTYTASMSGNNLVWSDSAGTTWNGTPDGNGTIAFANSATGPTVLQNASGTYYQPTALTNPLKVTFGGVTAYAPSGGGTLYTTATGSTPAAASFASAVFLKVSGTAAPSTIQLATLAADGKTITFTDGAAGTPNTVIQDATASGVVPGASTYGVSSTSATSTNISAGSATSLTQGVHANGNATATPLGSFTRSSSTPTGTTGALTDPNSTGYYSYTIPSAWYDSTTLSLKDTRVYQDSTDITSQLTAANLDSANCSVPSVAAPTSKWVSSSNGTITVTKGDGITWNVSTAAATTATTDGKFSDNTTSLSASSNKDLGWATGASSSTTQTITVSGSGLVTVTPSLASGYTGVMPAASTFKFDTMAQTTYTAPTATDVDGKDNDTFTVTNNPNVDYYYTADPTLAGNAKTQAAQAAGTYTVAALDKSTNASDVMNKWIPLPQDSGATTIVQRPSALTMQTAPNDDKTKTFTVIAVAKAGYKFNADGRTVAATDLTWTDHKTVAAIPAPTTVDNDGSNDYYVLPKITGVKWTVKTSGVADVVYPSSDGRLGTQIPVYTNGAKKDYTFIAEAESGYVLGTGVTKTTWTASFDSRASLTPTAPTFNDETGTVNDAVNFPILQPGITYYTYDLAKADGTTVSGTTADASWYGTKVKLSDLQKLAGNLTNDYTKVTLHAQLSTSMYKWALQADGVTDVKHDWSYTFTNGINIVPVAPTQAAVDGQNYTLTFPVDPKVTYSVTQNGITKTIAYGDLGKALPYTGAAKVTVTAQSGYVIQPNTDGTTTNTWMFASPGSIVTPLAPTGHDNDGLTGDNYSLPKQAGIIWNVNGVDVDPSQYGKDLSTNSQKTIVVVAQAADGYSIKAGADTKWTLKFTDGTVTPLPPTVGNEVDDTASVPTAHVTWSSDNAASYKVTYQKLLANGQRGPELPWFNNTDKTSANFVANPGDKYYVRVVAVGANGSASDVKETLIEFGIPEGLTDITTGVGTFNNAWQQLTNLMATQKLPYYGDTAALGYTNAQWTVTLPKGTAHFDLYATVHDLGAHGKIQVNGQNWADFDTNSTVWDQVSDPYSYPVRTIGGWDTSKPVTIKVIATDAGTLYLALDAYKAY